jgi:hypothetical protein
MTAVLAVQLLATSWPLQDVYNFLYRATTMTWGETLQFAFGNDVTYRPLFVIGVKLAHQLVGLRLWLFRTLVVLQFAGVLFCLIWLLRPVTSRRAIAACIALACVAGLHTSRVLTVFVPLNHFSFGVLLLLLAIGLAMSPGMRRAEWVFLPLTLCALFVHEFCVLIVPALLVLWKMGAPGVSRRSLVSIAAALAIYITTRLTFGAPATFTAYAETGLGFANVSAPDLSEIFAHAPWMLWIYNVVATALTVALSEPHEGRYRFVEALLHANVPLWMSIHVATSLLGTALMILALVRRWIVDARDRQLAGAGLVLWMAGSVLGFAYTRDRVGTAAGIGYAILLYVSLVSMLEVRRRVVAYACVALLAVGWVIRSIEASYQLRDTAWENRQEWITRYGEFAGENRPPTDLLLTMRRQALECTPEDPRNDPAWTYALFEREFERNQR